LCQTCKDKNQNGEIHTAEHGFSEIYRPFYRRCQRPQKNDKVDDQKSNEVKPAEVKCSQTQTVDPKTWEQVQERKLNEVPCQTEVPCQSEVPCQTEVSCQSEIPCRTEAPLQPKQDPFEQQLTQLNEMGFLDKEKNLRFLVKNQGDLVATVRDLLE